MRSSQLKRILVLPLIFAALSTAQAENLDEIYNEAKLHDPTFAAARATDQSGQEQLPQALSQLLPSIAIGTTNSNNIATVPGSRSQYNAQGYSVSLSQPIYQKQSFLQYKQAKYQVDIADAQFSLAWQDLVNRVAQAYFNILLAQDTLRSVGGQVAMLTEQLALAKRHDKGGVEGGDVIEAQSRLDIALTQEADDKNNLENAKIAMVQLTGRLPGALSGVDESLELKYPDLGDMAKWVDAAEEHNLQIQIQRATLENANLAVENAHAGYYPTVSLVASYSSDRKSVV